jgi:predicted amino acid racemase
VPSGEISQDAFGNRPVFDDLGVIRRGVAALGRQDTLIDGLLPLDPGVRVLGGSSDHLLLHVPDPALGVGSVVRFAVSYGALLQAWTSPYVGKRFTGKRAVAATPATIPS